MRHAIRLIISKRRGMDNTGPVSHGITFDNNVTGRAMIHPFAESNGRGDCRSRPRSRVDNKNLRAPTAPPSLSVIVGRRLPFPDGPTRRDVGHARDPSGTVAAKNTRADTETDTAVRLASRPAPASRYFGIYLRLSRVIIGL